MTATPATMRHIRAIATATARRDVRDRAGLGADLWRDTLAFPTGRPDGVRYTDVVVRADSARRGSVAGVGEVEADGGVMTGGAETGGVFEIGGAEMGGAGAKVDADTSKIRPSDWRRNSTGVPHSSESGRARLTASRASRTAASIGRPLATAS